MSTESQIEDYLDHICAPLVGLAPYEARQKLRAELRGHLEALVVARREIGACPEGAVREALAQFGDPRIVARQWAREWLRSQRPGRVEPARPATFVALGSFGLVTVASAAIAVAAQDSRSVVPVMMALSTPIVLWGMPVVAGFVTGLIAPARHVLGTFYALALLIAITSLSGLVALRGTALEELLTLSLIQVFFWMPLGCATASIGGWLQQRWDERPRRWGVPA
jgi:hypothetical protein